MHELSTRGRDRSTGTAPPTRRHSSRERGAKPPPATVHAPPRMRHGWALRRSSSGWTTPHGRCSPPPTASTWCRGPQAPPRASGSITPRSPTCSVSGGRRSVWSSAGGPRAIRPRTTRSAPGIRSSAPSSTGEPSIDRGTSRSRRGMGHRSTSDSGSVSARLQPTRHSSSGKPDSSSCRTCSRKRRWMPSMQTCAPQSRRPGPATARRGGRPPAAARPTPAGSSTSHSSRPLCAA